MHQILGFKIEKRNIVNLKKAYFKSPLGKGKKFRERLARIKQKLEKLKQTVLPIFEYIF